VEVYLFDVEHGGCAAIITPSGRLMLIDAGHNDTTGWRLRCAAPKTSRKVIIMLGLDVLATPQAWRRRAVVILMRAQRYLRSG
jgi:hypothetical protein